MMRSRKEERRRERRKKMKYGDGLHTGESCNEQRFMCYLAIFLLLIIFLLSIGYVIRIEKR